MSMHGNRSSRQGPRFGPGRGRGPMGHRGPMAMMQGEKARDFKGTMRNLLGYLRQYRVALLFVMMIAMASTAASIVGPKILGKATTRLFEGVMAQIAGTREIDFPAIGRILLTVLGVQLITSGLLAELVIRTYYESQGKSIYIVRDELGQPEAGAGKQGMRDRE